MRVAVEVQLTKSERSTLTHWSRSRRISVRQAQRAQMILLAAKGYSNADIAEELGLSVKTVSTRRTRILEKMKMKNNVELTRYVLKNRIVD